MINYLVTDMTFPFEGSADGGTAFTAYEWAAEVHNSFGQCVVLYHGKKQINTKDLPFDVVSVKTFKTKFQILSKARKGDKIFLNSAFKSFEMLYAVIDNSHEIKPLLAGPWVSRLDTV